MLNYEKTPKRRHIFQMKRLFSMLLSVSCVSVILLCGCGDSGSSAAPKTFSDDTKPQSSLSSAAHDTTGTKAQSSTENTENTENTEATAQGGSFSNENGFIVYNENGQRASITGIDISSYSGEVDWSRVKNAGIDFVMVRLGGRGYGNEGSLYSDNKATDYISGAQAAGIKTGGYFFSQAITEEEAREEALYCQQVLGGLKLDFPLAYDWEIIKEDTARTDSLTAEQATSCALAFCAKAKELGYKPMLYASDEEFSKKYDMSRLSDCDIWYCEYADEPHFSYRFSMWQYSKTASVDGIEGNVDLDLCFTNIAEY